MTKRSKTKIPEEPLRTTQGSDDEKIHNLIKQRKLQQDALTKIMKAMDRLTGGDKKKR
jgi:hypothetical protein